MGGWDSSPQVCNSRKLGSVEELGLKPGTAGNMFLRLTSLFESQSYKESKGVTNRKGVTENVNFHLLAHCPGPHWPGLSWVGTRSQEIPGVSHVGRGEVGS